MSDSKAFRTVGESYSQAECNNKFEPKSSETVLWENDSPTTGRPTSGDTETITLSESIDNFNEIIIIFKQNATSNENRITHKVYIDKDNTGLTYAVGPVLCNGSYSNGSFVSRTVTITGTSLIILKANWWTNGWGSSDKGTNANELLPIKVIGIKR